MQEDTAILIVILGKVNALTHIMGGLVIIFVIFFIIAGLCMRLILFKVQRVLH
jgi:hypothetical protein